MSVEPPVIVLAFANDRYGGDAAYLRNLAAERRGIEAVLRPAVRGGHCRVIVEANTTHERFFDIVSAHADRLVGVHFGGHGHPDGLRFEDESGQPVDAHVEGIAAALAACPRMRWVFLNGCATAAQVDALHRAGVDWVLATVHAIRDDLAARFGRRVHYALAHGHDVQQAFDLAEADGRAWARTPESTLRQVDADPRFRHGRPVEETSTWPWILRRRAGAAPWRLVTRATPGPVTPLEAAVEQRAALADGGAPPAVIAGLDRRILDLKREALTGRRPDAGVCLGQRWHLIEAVGQGGFAEVWTAWDAATDETVAVKILHDRFADSAERRQRFFRGARQMARLIHPHVVRVVDVGGEDGGWHYFVMAHLPGGDLAAAVTDGAMEPTRALAAVCAVADALAAGHALGIVHRDVKPSNILLDADGVAQLTDFDLVMARDTTGVTRGGLGTFLYAAPEVLEDAGVAGPASDIYGLGMTALFALKGEPLSGLAMRDPDRELHAVEGFSTVKAVILRATAWQASARHRSMADFAAALRRALARSEAPVAPLTAGALLSDRYRVIARSHRVGAGGAWSATDELLRRPVVVWLMAPWMSDYDSARARFEAEVERRRSLRHPNTLIVYDAGQTDGGRLFLVTEAFDGRPLSAVLAAGEPMPVDRALRIAHAVCGALAEAHRAGFVHAELDPACILLTPDTGRDRVKLTGFRMSRRDEGETHPRLTNMGSDRLPRGPAYAPPEVGLDRPEGPAGDVYRLGAVLYHLIVGQPLFPGQSMMALLVAHMTQPPPLMAEQRPDLDIPPAVEALVQQSLAKTPEARQPDAAHMQAQLEAVLGLESAPQTPAPTGLDYAESADADVAGDASTMSGEAPVSAMSGEGRVGGVTLALIVAIGLGVLFALTR